MRLNLIQTHPLCGITVQYFANEIHYFTTQVNREFDIHFEYFVVGLVFVGFALEGSFSSAKLIAQYPQAPDVSSLIIKLSSNYLWRDIVKSTAESLSLTE